MHTDRSASPEALGSPPPLVSVIMAAYNREEYIAEAIESVLGQTYPDWELLIADDGSTDKTAVIAQRYAKFDSRIKVLQQSNQGAGAARNLAMRNAQGSLFAIHDSDDLSHPKRFEKQVAYLTQHPKVVIVGTWSASLKGDTHPIQHPTSNGALQYSLLLENSFVHPSCMIRRRENPIYYPEHLRTAQDYSFLTELARTGEIGNIPETLYHMRYHDASLSSLFKQEQREHAIEIAKRHLQWWCNQPDFPQVDAAVIDACFQNDIPSKLKPDVRKWHQSITNYFQQRFQNERKEIARISLKTIAVSRHSFFSRNPADWLKRTAIILHYYKQWPKSMFYLLLTEQFGLKILSSFRRCHSDVRVI